MVQKQNKCRGHKYLSCKLVQNTFSTLEIIQDSAQLDSTHRWCFWTKRWSVLSLDDTPAYLFTSIPCKIYAWTLKCGHRHLTMAVWPSVIHAYRKFIAKNNKWMGQWTHSKKCNILQWKSEKALLNENWLRSSVNFTIPSNGRTKHQFHEFSH